jgi:NADPH:quinone reductase-like Zn-dependent oxidoreductase
MGASNRSVLAFNLSFFADEDAMVSELFDQVWKWLDEGALKCPRVVVMAMTQVDEAHDLIQSGASIGKIVLKTS